MSGVEGLAHPLTEVSTTQKHELGMKVWQTVTHSGKKYRNVYQYVVAGGAITGGVYTMFNGDTPFEVVVGATAITLNILGAGVAMATLASGEFGWILTEGVVTTGSLTTTNISYLLANVTTGALTAPGNTTEALNAVGMVTVDDVTILFPPGQAGRAADA